MQVVIIKTYKFNATYIRQNCGHWRENIFPGTDFTNDKVGNHLFNSSVFLSLKYDFCNYTKTPRCHCTSTIKSPKNKTANQWTENNSNVTSYRLAILCGFDRNLGSSPSAWVLIRLPLTYINTYKNTTETGDRSSSQ